MTEDELQNRVVHNIRALRKSLKMSQEKLADKADLSRQMMNDIEGGRRFLSKASLVKIANALGVDVHELFLPAKSESQKISSAYDEITKKVVADVKKAVNETLLKM